MMTFSFRRASIFAFLFCVIINTSAYALVDMRNGNYSNTWIDIQFDDGFKISRTYNSRSLFNGIFGFGWCSDYESRLAQIGSDIVYQACGAGAKTTFKYIRHDKSEDRSYFRSDSGDNMYFDGNNYILKFNNIENINLDRVNAFYKCNNNSLIGSVKFDVSGQVVEIVCGNDVITIVNASDRISYIKYRTHKLYFHWGANGKVSEITHDAESITRDAELSKIEFGYDENVNLTVVRNAWKNTYRYFYDELHNLIKATWPDGTDIVIEYDKEHDWVKSFQDRLHCKESYTYYDISPDHYLADVTKTCNSAVVTKSRYEFLHRYDERGAKYLYRVRVTEGRKFKDVEYDPAGHAHILANRDSQGPSDVVELHEPLPEK